MKTTLIEGAPHDARVERAEFEVDASPRGYRASYGAGVCGTEWTYATMGVGRSPRAAANDALECCAQGLEFTDDELARLGALADRQPDDETAVEEAEAAVVDEICRSRFGKPYAECTHDEQQAAQDDTALSYAVELTAVLWIRSATLD